MERNKNIVPETMTESDIEEAVSLIALTMNGDEADWARENINFYFECKKRKINPSREYYVWRDEGKIYGLVGLHRYIWGPKENVWLSWFAVHPERQRGGIGSRLIDFIKERAVEKGYKKLFVETYAQDTFWEARTFYRSKGFSEVGRIENYLPDESSMVVYKMDIE